MKKILFLLLMTVSVYSQVSTGQEQEFDYGIKNNATQTVTNPDYLTTTGADGTQGKVLGNAYTKSDRTININGVTQDLSANRDFQTGYADTGVLTFAGLSANSSTTINIGACKGWIIDNETNPLVPTKTYIDYAGATNVTVPGVGSAIGSYVLLNASGITFITTQPTPAQRKAYIYLGKVGHPSGSITVVANTPDNSLSPLGQVRALYNAIDFINEGVSVAPNGANLNVNLTAGYITGSGINFVNDNTTPNRLTVAPQTPATFIYRTQTGAGGGATTTITPGNYDVGGVVTAVPGGSNTATIQYVFYAPGAGVFFQLGQTTYASLSDAVANADKETFTIYPNFVDNVIPIGQLVVIKSATDLSNTSQARFLKADKFGELGGASAGISTATQQSAYNNSLIPQIVTSTALGAMTYRRGSASDTDNIIAGQNGAGTTTFGVTGNGAVTGLTWNGYSPENIVNKVTDFTTVNNTLYPTVQAVKTYTDGIAQASTAYVDVNGNNTNAILGNPLKPYLTIDGALDALPASGGVVKIGVGSFSSPTPSKIKSNTFFIGSKEPVINSTVTISSPNTRPTISAPTALVNGTILTGLFSSLDKTNIRVENLGVDVGKTWTDTFNGGTPVAGLIIASITPTAPIKNIAVNNVTVLGYSPTSTEHDMLFENVIDSKFTNLTTYYNVHGVVLKGINIVADNIKAHSHGNDGLIIKSDTYAPTRDIAVNNINITSLSGYEGAGIILEEGVNGSSLLERVSLNNINLKYVKFGLKNVNKISNVNISNLNINDSQTYGVKFDSDVDKINISGLNIFQTTTDGVDVSLTGSEVVNISNSNLSDITGIGYKLTTTSNSVINLVNSNTLNTTSSYSITGSGVYGHSNFGTGTTSGNINMSIVGDLSNKGDVNLATRLGTVVGKVNIGNNNNGASAVNMFGSSSQKGWQIGSNITVADALEFAPATTSGGTTFSSPIMKLLPTGIELTGTPTAPTATAGTNTTQIATTAFVLANAGGTGANYTPTTSNETNCSSTTASSISTYTNSNGVITVSVTGSASITSANTNTSFDVSLPVNISNLAYVGSGAVIDTSSFVVPCIIIGQTASTVRVKFKPTATGSIGYSFVIQYN